MKFALHKTRAEGLHLHTAPFQFALQELREGVYERLGCSCIRGTLGSWEEPMGALKAGREETLMMEPCPRPIMPGSTGPRETGHRQYLQVDQLFGLIGVKLNEWLVPTRSQHY